MLRKKILQISVTSLLLGVLLFTTACTKGGTQQAKDAYKAVNLVYWSVWNEREDMRDLIRAYQKLRPNVTIDYRKWRYEEYEQQLLEAFAEDRGPDILSLNNTWVAEYKSKLQPLPTQIVLPTSTIQGTIKKEQVVQLVTKKSLTPLEVRNKFLDVVARDVIWPETTGEGANQKTTERIWGLPLGLDTLVLFYNKNLLNNAGIAEPPVSWTEFQDQVKRITKIDAATGKVQVSGVAMGTAANVARSFDILSLLMMQNLAPMVNDRGDAVFNQLPPELAGVQVAPGQGALEYYTQFAAPLFEGYCWNNTLGNSLDVFVKGRAGFFFGYSYNRDAIRAQAPKLDFGVAPVPQVSEAQKVNYANYWVETVSKKSANKNYAWDFIQFITSEDNVSKYLDKVKKPTALRSSKLISKQLSDPDLRAFADELLTAQSWYRGYKPNNAEKIFNEMIDNVVTGKATSNEALKQAVGQINLIINNPL